MSSTIDRKIELGERRCYFCHRWFLYEPDGSMSPGCPWCSKKELENTHKEMARLQRSIYSLRGYITRLRGKKKS